jgi:electron transfer flavoprotein alpha subunit
MNKIYVTKKESDGNISVKAVGEEPGGLERELAQSGFIEWMLHVKRMEARDGKIIVSGGRGMNSANHFRSLFELADALGGTVGASRAAIEAGWISYEYKIGRTGKQVSPAAYIACGISGAVQHLAGVRADRIIAINHDRDAPIFQAADYGIVGDAESILQLLIRMFRAL